MTKPSTPLFQGRDWSTYRWPVAQAFDALDRMQDVCLYTDHETEEHEGFLHSVLHDLYSYLDAQLLIVYGDTVPATLATGTSQQQMDCLQTRILSRSLHKAIEAMDTASTEKVDPLLYLCQQIKEHVKRIDA